MEVTQLQWKFALVRSAVGIFTQVYSCVDVDTVGLILVEVYVTDRPGICSFSPLV